MNQLPKILTFSYLSLLIAGMVNTIIKSYWILYFILDAFSQGGI